jgi:HTH-type transcriptional regulator/antitoxin HigA
VPRVIETDPGNERAIAELERLDSLPRMTTEQKSLADLLTLLIERFEQRYELGHAEPVAAVLTLMEERGLRQRDLIPVFGSSRVTSGVLNVFQVPVSLFT